MPVLGTKLHIPASRRQLVARPRLTDQLRVEPASTPRLVLISAPAGFGKTTLMVQWLALRASANTDPAGRPSRGVAVPRCRGQRPAPVPHPPRRRSPDGRPPRGAEAPALTGTDRGIPTEAVLVVCRRVHRWCPAR